MASIFSALGSFSGFAYTLIGIAAFLGLKLATDSGSFNRKLFVDVSETLPGPAAGKPIDRGTIEGAMAAKDRISATFGIPVTVRELAEACRMGGWHGNAAAPDALLSLAGEAESLGYYVDGEVVLEPKKGMEQLALRRVYDYAMESGALELCGDAERTLRLANPLLFAGGKILRPFSGKQRGKVENVLLFGETGAKSFSDFIVACRGEGPRVLAEACLGRLKIVDGRSGERIG